MNNSYLTRVSLPEVVLPSGRKVVFRLPSKLEKRFIQHIRSAEYMDDNVLMEEFLCMLCITKVDGTPVDHGPVNDFLQPFSENKGRGNSRLNPQSKISVCHYLYDMIITLFDDNPEDWEVCVAIWAGAGGINTEEDRKCIDEQVKNILAAKADTTITTREFTGAADSGAKIVGL